MTELFQKLEPKLTYFLLFKDFFLSSHAADNNVLIGLMVFVVPLLIEILLFEMMIIKVQGIKYNLWQNILKFTAILFAVINLADFDECSDTFGRNVRNEKKLLIFCFILVQMSAISSLLVWFYFFIVISIHPVIGTDTLIFFKVTYFSGHEGAEPCGSLHLFSATHLS